MIPTVREMLRHVPYLAALDAEEFARLAAACEVRALPKGTRLFTEGDPAPGLVLIVSGRIKVLRIGADGREQVLHEEGAGATLAEVPVFDGEGCVGTAVAAQDSAVVVVPARPLLDAIERNPAAARAVIRTLAVRFRRFASTIEDLSLRGIAGRLAAFLVREHDRTGDTTLTLPATREELAAHLGTVREEASRALSQLKRAGVIDVDGRTVRLLSPRRLRSLADTA